MSYSIGMVYLRGKSSKGAQYSIFVANDIVWFRYIFVQTKNVFHKFFGTFCKTFDMLKEYVIPTISFAHGTLLYSFVRFNSCFFFKLHST